ncbi:hypothetical protein DET54_12124 [Paenibacillus pabuli]|uniref:YolD-like protein n=1 Tax=Paenibacillus pabuli TaxID=1472 RepID=A0ABX9BC86_9BACL|nr:hypothetical protein DET54_12124 [Paenibacillus pabuli]
MIKDLLLADSKQYSVLLVFNDESKYIGQISMSEDKKWVKVKHQHGIEWVPLNEISSYSLSIPITPQ